MITANDFFCDFEMQYIEKMPYESGFLTTPGSVECRLFRASRGFAPWTPIRVLPWTRWGAYSAPRPPAVFDLMECFSQINPPPPVVKSCLRPWTVMTNLHFKFSGLSLGYRLCIQSSTSKPRQNQFV